MRTRKHEGKKRKRETSTENCAGKACLWFSSYLSPICRTTLCCTSYSARPHRFLGSGRFAKTIMILRSERASFSTHLFHSRNQLARWPNESLDGGATGCCRSFFDLQATSSASVRHSCDARYELPDRHCTQRGDEQSDRTLSASPSRFHLRLLAPPPLSLTEIQRRDHDDNTNHGNRRRLRARAFAPSSSRKSNTFAHQCVPTGRKPFLMQAHNAAPSVPQLKSSFCA